MNIKQMGVNISRISFLQRSLSEQRKTELKTRRYAIGRNEREDYAVINLGRQTRVTVPEGYDNVRI